MKLSITTGIVDNDPNGETDIGTIFWFKIFYKSPSLLIDKTLTHGLLELADLGGKINLQAIVDELEAQAKADSELQTKAEIKNTPAQIIGKLPAAQLDAVNKLIVENVAIIEQFKNGKDKALNALIGKIMKSFPMADPEAVRQGFINATQ